MLRKVLIKSCFDSKTIMVFRGADACIGFLFLKLVLSPALASINKELSLAVNKNLRGFLSEMVLAPSLNLS